MGDEGLFEPSSKESSSLDYKPRGGRKPTGVNRANHPNFLRYETGSRPNGSEYRLEIRDDGRYSLDILESPWVVLDKDGLFEAGEEASPIEGYVNRIEPYSDLKDDLKKINLDRETERLDDFIDFLVERELR